MPAGRGNGILSATTAFGKTVVALWLIAERKVNTLILVHRTQLLEQWVERISQFLGVPKKSFGRFGGGHKKRIGTIDVALIQSVSRKGKVEEWVKEYGQVIEATDKSKSVVILATGRYLGEGFDLPNLDTLFLTFPVSWRGTLAQYAGRLHREFAGKTEVIVYDYMDQNVPVLSRMHGKRLKGYAALGYKVLDTSLT